MKSLDIATVATNNYVDYWINLALSAEKYLVLPITVTLHVFTDNPKKCQSIKNDLKNVSVEIYEIESLKWPEATLFRYKIFTKFQSSFKADYLMHLDADMLIHRDFLEILEKSVTKNDVSLVSHPGFFRPRFSKKVVFYIRNFKYLLADLRSLILSGGIGSWETSKKSSAFVPRSLRSHYVCGGTWLGKSTALKKMITELAICVDVDLMNGVTAIWHDESHLNSWASRNKFNLLSPSFCADPSYPQLEGLPIYIEAIDKKKL